jgi:fibronectin type 3 domain-containing protein
VFIRISAFVLSAVLFGGQTFLAADEFQMETEPSQDVYQMETESSNDVYAISARSYYVSPNGTSDGTSASSPASIYEICKIVQPGDTVNLLGGLYDEPTPVILSRSGTESAPITWQNFNGQEVIFDGGDRDVNFADPYIEKCVIQLDHCDWQIIKGITVKNSPAHGIGDFGYASNHNVYQNIIAEDNYGNGIIVRGDYNTLIDCVSRYNYDFAGVNGKDPGGNADGISPDGRHNKLVRCISHHNSDDGYDCWFGEHGMFINCLAFSNGSTEGCRNRDHGDWEAKFEGDGNGFKLGKGGCSSATSYQAFNTTIRCIAYDNLSGGFTTNQGGGNLFIHNTAYNNNTRDGGEKGFNTTDSESNSGTRTNIFINNLALNTFTKPIKMSGTVIRDHNSWDFWNQDTYDLNVLLKYISASEFVSVSFPTEFYSWNEIAASDFLKLKATSLSLDKAGSAKDILKRIAYTDKSIPLYDPATDRGFEIDEILTELDQFNSYTGNGYDLGAFELAVSKPAKPTGLKAVSTGNNCDSIKLTWNAVTGATGYSIYRSTSPDSGFTYLKGVTTNSYTNSGLTTGKTYYYRIKAYAMVGGNKVMGSVSDTVNAKPVPAKPTGLKAVSAGYNSNKLTWNAVTGATGYSIYRSISPNNGFTYLKGVTGTSYTNTGLKTGTTYYYRICAYVMVGTNKVMSPVSATVNAKPIPAKPTGLKATVASTASIKVSWNTVAGATGYSIYRSTSPGSGFTYLKGVTGTSYTNTGLTTGTTYYYKVKAYTMVGTTKILSSATTAVGAKI